MATQIKVYPFKVVDTRRGMRIGRAYKYRITADNLTVKEMEGFEKIEFLFSVNATDKDKEFVFKRWEHKIWKRQ